MKRSWAVVGRKKKTTRKIERKEAIRKKKGDGFSAFFNVL